MSTVAHHADSPGPPCESTCEPQHSPSAAARNHKLNAAPDPDPSGVAVTSTLSTASAHPPALQSAFEPQLSERDSIFATHYADASYHDLPHPTSSTSLPRPISHPKPAMATSTIYRRPDTSLLSQSLLNPTYSSVDNRLLTNRRSGMTTASPSRPSSPPGSSNSHRAFSHSETSPEHVLALPPLASPSQSPRDSPAPRRHTALPVPASIDPSSEERLKYRSWREGRPHLTGHAMPDAAAQQKTSDAQHAYIDKTIEATLPRADQSSLARSRKTTHTLGIFKEEDAASDQGSARRDRSESKYRRQSAAFEDPRGLRSPVSASNEYYSFIGSPRRYQSPDRLNQDISPAAESRPASTSHSTFTSAASVATPATTLDFGTVVDQGSHLGDDEEEHISGAVYYPHQIHEPSTSSRPRSSSDTQVADAAENWPSQDSDSQAKGVRSRSQSAQDEERVEFAIQSEDESQYLHGDIAPVSRTRSDTAVTGSNASFFSESEQDRSDAEDEEGPGATTPRAPSIMQAAAAAAAAAASSGIERRASFLLPRGVELKPFSHQVGGHTAIYRFSRRAVCKRLNNKENKFYETVERFHPEVLEFVPR